MVIKAREHPIRKSPIDSIPVRFEFVNRCTVLELRKRPRCFWFLYFEILMSKHAISIWATGYAMVAKGTVAKGIVDQWK